MEPVFLDQSSGDHLTWPCFDLPYWQHESPWAGPVDHYSSVLTNPLNGIPPPLLGFDMNRAGVDDALYSMEFTSTSLSASAEERDSFQALPQPSMLNPSISLKKRKGRSKLEGDISSSPSPSPKRACALHAANAFSSIAPGALDVQFERGESFHQRSRTASTRFRERKRNEIAELELRETSIEGDNRQLRDVLNALTREIVSLKMQILQHTNCDCKLIQAYISKEAMHFVESLETVDA